MTEKDTTANVTSGERSGARSGIAFSAIGVAVVAIILLAGNFILSAVRARVDLTEGQVYTLSDGTRAILAKLDGPVKIRYYATRNSTLAPPAYRAYMQHVEDMLAEYKQAAGGKLVVEKFDPQPDSEAEDSANLDGVQGQQLASGEKLYHGLAVSRLDQKVAIPVLSPERETLLEYDLSRAIASVNQTEKPMVGIMTALPVFGSPFPGPQGSAPPWTFVSELRRDYGIKNLTVDVDQIDADVKVLLVVHPRDITDRGQYAIDQFLLRGGKVIAFVDPYCYFDRQRSAGNFMPFGRSSLPRLFEAWGVKFDVSRALADTDHATNVQNALMPTLLSLGHESVDGGDVVTGQIQSLLLPFPGAFTVSPPAGIKQQVLLHSSKASQMIDAAVAGPPGDQIMQNFKPGGVELPIAVRLTGKFKTAFPAGKPKPPADAKPPEGGDKPAADAKPLTEATAEGTVIVVADADMLADEASVEVRDFMGERIVVPRNHNLSFLQNAIEQLSGDSNLISLRSRASFSRPFTVIRAIEAKAVEAYQDKIKGLEDSLAATRQRLAELQRQKGGGQQEFILSPEQQAEIDNFRHKESETKRELKDLRKSLRKDTDAVEFWTKLFNILAMPILVALLGLVLALVKRNRMAAR